MKSDRMLQTRRKAPKSTFTMLYAATRSTKRRKQRAATAVAPEDVGEVPGVGIARALVVILLIHVAAIAGIYLHNRGNDSSDLKAVPVVDKEKPPAILPGYQVGFLEPGENYATMAQRYGVDEQELRRLNDNASLNLGWKYNIPKKRIEEATPSEAIVGTINPPVEQTLPQPEPVVEPPVIPNERPEIQTSDTQILPGATPGPLAQVGDNEPELEAPLPTPDPILIKPKNPHPLAPAATGKTYTVKSGDTFWGISRKFGVNVNELMKVNGIQNASALKIGAVLKIPAKQ